MWTGDDLAYLQKNYPSLKLKTPTIVEGQLLFQAVRINNQLVLNPNNGLLKQALVANDLYLCDSYAVRLEWKKNATYPLVYEIGGKIANTAKRLSKTSLDMHKFSNGALCLAPPVELIRALSKDLKIRVLIEEFVIPYLFAQSHYAKGQVWIWGERSHGSLGVFESYFEFRGSGNDFELIKEYITSLEIAGDQASYVQALVRKRKVKGHWLCFCGSQKKFRKCHNLAFRGMWSLKEDLKRSKLKVYNLMSGYYKNWQEYQKST